MYLINYYLSASEDASDGQKLSGVPSRVCCNKVPIFSIMSFRASGWIFFDILEEWGWYAIRCQCRWWSLPVSLEGASRHRENNLVLGINLDAH